MVCHKVLHYPESLPQQVIRSATGIPMARQTTLEEAVYWLWARHAQGDVLLLSPACASWDMFRDYAERSARFIACARAIAAEEQAC